MPTIIHDAIVVTGHFDNELQRMHDLAKSLELIVTPIVHGAANGYRTFCVVPDGSSEGWTLSRTQDFRRNEFLNTLRKTRHIDYVHVRYGECEPYIKTPKNEERDE